MTTLNAFAAVEPKSNSSQPQQELNGFEKAIKAYLDNYAKQDEVFAGKYHSGKKTIKGCCNFIIAEAKKDFMLNGGHMAIMDDATGYGMAVHYFDEDSIKEEDQKPQQAKVAHSNQPTPKGAIADAITKSQAKQKQKAKKAETPKKVEAPKPKTEHVDPFAHIFEEPKNMSTGMDLFANL